MAEKMTMLLGNKQQLLEHEQIAAALSPQRMRPLLEQVFLLELQEAKRKDQPYRDKGQTTVCRILDMKYEPGSYCKILYELGDHLITGSYEWDSDKSQNIDGIRVISSLGMRVYRFPNDPVLPSLTKALDSQEISTALSGALPEIQTGAVRILRCIVKPLRFRPGRRCTVRLSLWLRDTASGAIYKRVLYGKIYHDLEKAERVYLQMQALSHSIPATKGHSTFATATAFLPDLAMVLQEPVEGVPLDGLINCETETCDPRALAGTVLAASALAAFHASGLADGKSRSISSELARFKKRGARIGQVNPQLGGEIIKLADGLSSWLDSLDGWGATSCLVHGDCKPAQFLVKDQQVALLDFDHCGMADPAVDVGTFLATLQQMQVKQTIRNRGRLVRYSTWLPELKQSFLAAYCAASGSPPEFSARAGWYEAVGLLRKAIRGFERSPFSPLPAALIVAAWKGLETLPPPSQS